MNLKKIISVVLLFIAFISLNASIAKATDVAVTGSSAGVSTGNDNPTKVPSVPAGNIKVKLENKFEKKDIRNEAVKEIRDMRASSTEKMREMREDNREKIKEMRASTTDKMKEMRDNNRERMEEMRASTTAMFKEMKSEKRQIAKKMELKTFEIRKNALVKELNIAITNLTNISGRLSDRLNKDESTGKDVKNALNTANKKLAKAKTAVEALSAYSYASTTSSTASTTEVTLEKPRKIGDDAIKSVKDAREAFKNVIRILTPPQVQGSNASSTEPKSN